ncbi:hypothetical protein AC1031_014740 [Aphanomyces cochlioides]|nr:hypothetical protein AC1031_014740 [Aphanomyces cochlioides]
MPKVRTPEKTIAVARRSIWYARLWWMFFHILAYVFPIYSGIWTIYFDKWIPGLVLCVSLGVSNLICYICLQCSSPGFVPIKEKASEGEDTALEDSSDSLLEENQHFCDLCNVYPPLRAKHCKDCGRCVGHYDHHCVCAGVCVGRDNHRLFVLYLFTQTLEALWAMNILSHGYTLNDDFEEWLEENTPIMLLWVFGFFVFLLAFGLLSYHAYLIATNQSSWEHAKRSKITYLKDLPPDVLPFSQGTLMNIWLFLRGRPRNVWNVPVDAREEQPTVVVSVE